ncbi:hypothetical protein [Blastococcus sp. CT_GayMR16]|uniref:hypothetical protein n=1 Tax=Blastococcus sp. CT_GayMR16 TaxID=2559607 RepID=UPI0010747453|nr:hypothetical protein [Blastococcus sp. CT_GayMR16]TFV90601.1 hypothetical protein E4P38_04085 [Blastococcus sp. CT_GayMR16]
MSIARPLSRVLLGGALLGGAAFAVAGGLALGGPGLIGVGLAATLAGCTAAGIARESPAAGRGSAVESAVWAAGWTAAAVLVVAGVATVAGGTVAALAVAAGVIVFLGLRLNRARRATAGTGSRRGRQRPVHGGPTQRPVHRGGTTGLARYLQPVGALTTRALGDEWLRTTAALAGRLDPAARQSLVARREEALDELERRDPDGFARWLAAGPTPASDPAEFVRGGPVQHGPVADTDAA